MFSSNIRKSKTFAVKSTIQYYSTVLSSKLHVPANINWIKSAQEVCGINHNIIKSDIYIHLTLWVWSWMNSFSKYITTAFLYSMAILIIDLHII